MAKATGPTYDVPFRRRREGLTNYKKRLALVKSGKPRLVVRKSNRHMVVQVMLYESGGDKTVVSVSSKALRNFNWPERANTPTAYLTGLLAGKRAVAAGVSEVYLDIGLSAPSKGAVSFAALKGAVDGGLKTNFDQSVLDEKRTRGEHIAAYALQAPGKYSGYKKQGVDISKLPELFEKAKAAIMRGG